MERDQNKENSMLKVNMNSFPVTSFLSTQAQLYDLVSLCVTCIFLVENGVGNDRGFPSRGIEFPLEVRIFSQQEGQPPHFFLCTDLNVQSVGLCFFFFYNKLV